MKYHILLILFCFNYNLFSQVEMKYDQNSTHLPFWVKLMYEKKTNEGLVISEYNKFYKKNKFEKNKFTQYYKRWLRNISRSSNAKPTTKHRKAQISGNVLDRGILIKMLKAGVTLLELRIYIQ